MADDPIPISRVKATSPLSGDQMRAQTHAARETAAREIKEQLASEESLVSYAEQGSEFNPRAMGSGFLPLEKQTRKETQAPAQVVEEEEAVDPEIAQGIAEQFNKKNPELNPRSLLAMRANVFAKDSQEEILGKVRSTYPDASLADEALDFLIESAGKNAALKEKLVETKNDFNEVHGRDIRAGKNIQQVARNFSQQGLGNPTALRDLYRDIIANPRESSTLFEELSNAFTFDKMKVVIGFLLHSLGHDIKSKGPSISRPELQRLFSEARTMQAILGVYRFFYSRMSLVNGEFKRADLTLPSTINFQNLAKAFMAIIKERYPSMQKILTFSSMLGISEETLAKIIIFNQLRDALRNVSPKLFKSEQHRQDMLMTFIETLSTLEDELEDEDEEEEED